MTKLSPRRYVSQMMGIWFLASALGNLIGGRVGGHVDPASSGDGEERAEIEHMHAIMNEYQLEGRMRWLGTRLEKNLAGELYRHVADHRGIFVQPARIEA